VAVSRETDQPPAGVVRQLFPDDKAIGRFVDLLTTAGVERGLVGPAEAERMWSRHVLNCAVVGEAVPRSATVVDIGSGAGLPGIVLALSRFDLSVTLVEPLQRRAAFLDEVAADLRIGNVEVVRARAESLIGARLFDIATARAVAPLSRLVPWALPLCRSGGELLAMKGQKAADELAAAADVIAAFGGRSARIDTVGIGLAEPPTMLVRIQSSGQITASRKGRR
jgi:16S rRNA (guanine527-N7)-methyltransferase